MVALRLFHVIILEVCCPKAGGKPLISPSPQTSTHYPRSFPWAENVNPTRENWQTPWTQNPFEPYCSVSIEHTRSLTELAFTGVRRAGRLHHIPRYSPVSDTNSYPFSYRLSLVEGFSQAPAIPLSHASTNRELLILLNGLTAGGKEAGQPRGEALASHREAFETHALREGVVSRSPLPKILYDAGFHDGHIVPHA